MESADWGIFAAPIAVYTIAGIAAGYYFYRHISRRPDYRMSILEEGKTILKQTKKSNCHNIKLL